MNSENTSWDAIPSPDLHDLKVDWDYKTDEPDERRQSHRLSDQELIKMFGVACIPAKIATVRTVHRGILQDISETGLAVRLPDALAVDERVKLGFFLDGNKILCQGTVRHVNEGALGYTCGIRLSGLDEATRARLSSLYVSATLKRNR